MLGPSPLLQHGRERAAKYRDAPLLGGQSALTGWEPELSSARQALPPLVVHVDDDSGILHLTQIILDRFGPYRVMSFQHSAPALDACYEHHPALLITDVMRPNDIDGVTLCQWIRQDPLLYDLPLLLHTAKTDYGLQHLEGIAYVSKPCCPRDLVQVIDGLVEAGPLR